MAATPTKISELTDAGNAQNADQIPIARGFGGSATTLKLTVQKLLEPVNNAINNMVTNFNNLSGVKGLNDGDVTNAKLANRNGLSVIGRELTTFGPVVDIDGTANQVLRVNNSGTLLDFGAINLASSQAVTNVLPISAGGSGYMDGRTLVPTGAVMPMAANTAPVGWLICNGDPIGTSGTVQGVNASELQNLRNTLGITYGTYGQLPDLRGYFVRGSGINTDLVASGDFGKKQTDTFQGHKHGLHDPQHTHPTTVDQDGGHTHDTNAYNTIKESSGGNMGDGRTMYKDPTVKTSKEEIEISVSVTGNSTGVKVLSPTGDQATAGAGDSNGLGGATPRTSHETRPANIAMLYCIKY
jgi:microcystin-dependent protein